MSETYRWNGPQVPQMGAVTYLDSQGQNHFKNKGVMRALKARKRQEAETRNAKTPDNQRRKNRMAS